MSSIGGEYMGIPCGGEPLRRKGNNITEAREEALRKEGDRRTVERTARYLADDIICPPVQKKCMRRSEECFECWKSCLMEPSQ